MFLNLANVPQDLESQDTTFFHVWHEIDRNENEHFSKRTWMDLCLVISAMILLYFVSRVQFNVIPTFG